MGRKYALKVYREERLTEFDVCIDNEVDTLATINHPNLINIIEYGEGSKESSRDGTTKPFKYLMLELAENGSLWNHVALGGRFDEITARHFFK